MEKTRDEKMTSVRIGTRNATLDGDMGIPVDAQGMVVFAHGSGSGRHSPRNRFVADFLRQAGLATLLLDLLTREEEKVDEFTAEYRFDINLLAERLIGASEWLREQEEVGALPLGYFGASTGAAAALIAAAEIGERAAAAVSRGGRPDLAGPSLPDVKAPTLLIVGSRDYPVIDMNQAAFEQLGCEDKELVLVPGATHLFEEPGALEEVARLASDWFTRHLAGRLARHRV